MVLTTLWKGPTQVAARRLPWAGPQCPRGGERPRRRHSRSLGFRLPGPAQSPRGSCLFLGAPESPCTSEGQARCFCSTSKYLTAMGFEAIPMSNYAQVEGRPREAGRLSHCSAGEMGRASQGPAPSLGSLMGPVFRALPWGRGRSADPSPA